MKTSEEIIQTIKDQYCFYVCHINRWKERMMIATREDKQLKAKDYSEIIRDLVERKESIVTLYSHVMEIDYYTASSDLYEYWEGRKNNVND